jgi:hypothetical protein
LLDVGCQYRITRPQVCLVTNAREVHGQRRSPSPCPEYGDVANDETPLVEAGS